MNPIYINVGGLVAMGLDPSGDYLLIVSHSGRGVFSTATWEKIGRDSTVVYPENGFSLGIPPIDVEQVAVKEINYETGGLSMRTPDNRFTLYYLEGVIEVRPNPT